MSSKPGLSALLKTWHAFLFTIALLCLQVYGGDLTRSLVSLLLVVFFVIVRVAATTVRAMYGSDAQTLIDFISEIMFASWMVLNVPLLIKGVFFLFLGTTMVCLFLYSKLENRIMRGEVQDIISRAIELSTHVENVLAQAQARGLNTSRCEKIIENAEKFMVGAQKCFRGEYYTDGDTYVQNAIDMYEEALTCLKSLR